MTVLVLWEVEIQPEYWDTVAKNVLELLPDTRAFAGCQRVDPYIDQKNPHHLMLVEHWDSYSDYEKYVQWRTETGVLPNFLTMCASAPVLQSFEVMQ